MPKYLGETAVDQKDTPYKDYGPAEWAFTYLECYGGIDGSHHKQWVIDQCCRILKGTPVTIKLAKWDDGTEEYRFNTGEPSDAYKQWVQESLDNDYPTDEGIPP